MSVEGNLITNLNSEATELRTHLSNWITMKSWEFFFSCCALIWQSDVHGHKMALKVKDGSIKINRMFYNGAPDEEMAPKNQ